MAVGGLYTSSILANSTSYTYYRINITAVQASGNAPYVSEFEMTESTSVTTGISTGGNFLVSSGGITINATTLTQSVTTPLITISHASGTVNLNSVNDIFGTSAASNLFAIGHTSNGRLDISAPNIRSQGLVISHTSSGPLNIAGNLVPSGTNTNVISSTGTGTVSIVGNLSSPFSAAGINKTAGDLNVTGTCSGGLSNALIYSGAGTVTVVGAVSGGALGAGINASSGTINVTGAITASGFQAIFLPAGSATLNITGNSTASATAVGVSGVGSGTVTIVGNVINNGALMGIYNPRVNISAASTSQWQFNTSTPSPRILYSADSFPNSPAPSNVVNGVTYGPGLSLTGTCFVPAASNVLSGVPVDGTVGTYTTTPAAIATEIFTKLLSSTDFNTSGSFGKLVKDNVDAKSSDIKKNTDIIPAVV
jgi:hypothetical protein